MVNTVGILTGIKEIILLVAVLLHPKKKKVTKMLSEPIYHFVFLKKLKTEEATLGSKTEVM